MGYRTALLITLAQPVNAELIRAIESIPSVMEVKESRSGLDPLSPLTSKLTAVLEDGADTDETAYLIESIPGILSVDEFAAE